MSLSYKIFDFFFLIKKIFDNTVSDEGFDPRSPSKDE